MDISKTLKLLMDEKKINIVQLSQATGIPINSLKNYIYRGQEPRTKAMVSLKRFFHVTSDYLLGLAPENAKPDTPENVAFFGDVLTYALDDFKKKAGASAVSAEAHDTLAMAANVVNTLLDEPATVGKTLRDFNELLCNYRVLSDDGKNEVMRRAVEQRELEEFRATKKGREKRTSSLAFSAVARGGERMEGELTPEEAAAEAAQPSDDLDL